MRTEQALALTWQILCTAHVLPEGLKSFAAIIVGSWDARPYTNGPEKGL